MANIYSIGKSALLSANYAISVTGHNIANASTPGYNRQVILQSGKNGQQFGFGFVGSGVQLDDIRRVYDEFLGKQFLDTQSESSRLDTYYNQIAKINNKLADDTAGVSPALQQFFSAVQEIASTPTSAATREAMLSDADILAGRYNNLAKQLTEQRDLANAQIIHSVELINTYGQEIAKLNDQIARAQIAITDPAPNDLLDQRDYLISQLSQEIGVRTVVNGNSLDVYIGNGQPLVINNQAFAMYAEYSAKDPQQVEIGYINNGMKVQIPEKLLTGGNIKGYMDYRNEQIDPVLNQLGLIAINLAADFNKQHKLGMDLNGEMGEDFFSFNTVASVGNQAGTGSVKGTIDLDHVKDLVASNYEIQALAGGKYKITRQSDGTVFQDGSTLPDGTVWNGQMPVPVPIDGIKFEATGLNVGETLVLKPLNEIAASLDVLISDPNKIAAASPVRTGSGPNAISGTDNLGTGKISLGEVKGPGFATSGTLTFDKTAGTFTTDSNVWYYPPDGSAPTLYMAGATNVPYQEGATYNFGDFDFSITGDPETGDTFFIEPNTGGTGDNRNMLALAALQDAKTMLNGTASYQGAYSQLVNRVGAKTRELEVMSTSTGNLLNSIYEEQQSQSGVNGDEEAINLMRYQQNYNAASKVIQTANEMFDAILAIF
ncbi:flagellar hook-associated protein FlgK [Oxalobacter vibrioformis]|uniref:Flagellar hook-associated protein 1 n=1 Tax=Oxalobacter vibrioformis TaxID=933080 RepID=A0A9E9LZ26_9BURK|nr:flagellar hook-associated protein FlgK [Oxalobacter vibrioformis]WAW09533.1 flagellar hook-associated protein FlgK [Oxalobacter vibrioformis]